ncbi:MAG: hypothetical protein K8H88_32010, partial [Sandaracinaceae bacterium]|nr:hypothetical protein [Sandaracinaceae bacterium]
GLPNPLQVLGPMLGPAGQALGPEGPLSARFWESLKPVAIAGAVAVGGLALLWAASSARAALGQARSAERLLESGVPQALLTRGVVR